MAAVMPHPTTFTATTQLRHTSEPNQAWKNALRKEIEESLRHMFDEAKDTFEQKLKETDPFDTAARDKLKQDHTDTLQNIHRIADDLFADRLVQHRQRQRVTGNGGDGLLSGESIMEQQQRILEEIARQQQPGSAPAPTPSPQPARPYPSRQNSQRTTPSEISTSVDRDGEYFSPRPPIRNPTPVSPSRPDEERITGRPRGSSASNRQEARFSGERQGGDYSRSPIVDEPDEMDLPPRSFTETSSSSLRRGNSNAGHRPSIPEIWKPPISPEEDVLISRTSTIVRRSSVTSIGSGSYRSPSSTQFGDRADPTLNRQTSMSFRSSTGAQFSDRPEHKPVARQGSISSIGAQPYRLPTTHKIPERPESEDTDGSESESDRPTEVPQVSRPSGLSTSRPVPNEHSHPSEDAPRQSPMSSSPLANELIAPPRGPKNRRGENGPPVSTQNLQRQLDHRPPIVQRQLSSQETQTSDLDDDDEEEKERIREEQQREIEEREEEAARKEEEVRRKEERARRKEEAAKKKEEAARKKEEAAKKKEIEAKKQEAEARRKSQLAEQKEQEAREKEEAARKKEEETRKKEEEIKRREEELRKREQEFERREAEAREKEEQRLKLQQEEARKRLQEEKKRLQEVRRREQEERQRDAEREEVQHKQEEERWSEVERKQKEADRNAEITRKREQDLTRKEAQQKKKEEDQRRREVEAKQREEQERRRLEQEQEELEAQEAIRQVAEMERRDAEAKMKQEEFRRREEDIRRRAFERRTQDELDYHTEKATLSKPFSTPPSSSPRPIPNRNGANGTSQSSDRGSGSWTSSSSRPSFNSSTPPTSARTSTSSNTAKPTWSNPPGNGAKLGTSPLHSAPFDEAEWARRQEEMARKQQEAFRREQEQQEMKRQTQASRVVSKEDVIRIFDMHERQWAALQGSDELSWNAFPWPILKRPKDPEELTPTNIGAYVLSPHHPGDKSKSTKDRVKEHIKRWHPDRFETKYLPKVIPREREKVKEGAGVVARALNEMLTRSNVHEVFS